METNKKIKDLLTRIDNLTAEDKATIKELSEAAELDIKFNSRCKNCYADALLMLRLKYGISAENSEGVTTASGNFICRAKSIVWTFGGSKKVLTSQTDDATIEAYMKCFPNQKHYVRVQQEKKGEETND